MLKKLFKTELPPRVLMQQHLRKMSEYLTKLTMMRALLDDNVAVSTILGLTGDEYENLIVTMEASDERLVLETVKAKLMDEWKRKVDRKEIKKRHQPDYACYFCQ